MQMAIRHLSQTELAARWNISHRTLERWRWTGEGPQFIKIGGRVVYRQEDVEAFEAEQTRKSTAATAPQALDWAILDDATRWGVTLIEAVAEMDADRFWRGPSSPCGQRPNRASIATR